VCFSIYIYMCVCICMCARARLGKCMRVRACGCGCMGAGVILKACSLTYAACNSHAPYCMRPVCLHRIFPHYLTKGKIFGEKLLNIKYVLIFSTTFI
jgi:hypothetical protein